MANGNEKPIAYLWIPVLVFAIILAAFLIFFVRVPAKATPGDQLAFLVGSVILINVASIGLVVLINMATNRIDLSDLLKEPDGKTSLSRLQFLIFTFVISLSLFLITVHNYKFPDKIPPEILTLLGISASTYAVSKGITASAQKSNGNGGPPPNPANPQNPPPANPPNPPNPRQN